FLAPSPLAENDSTPAPDQRGRASTHARRKGDAEEEGRRAVVQSGRREPTVAPAAAAPAKRIAEGAANRSAEAQGDEEGRFRVRGSPREERVRACPTRGSSGLVGTRRARASDRWRLAPAGLRC
ncbi:unnamed protein product, partial [Urochloa humidicola]